MRQCKRFTTLKSLPKWQTSVCKMSGETYLVGDVTSDELSGVTIDTCVPSSLPGAESGFFR